MWCTCWHQMVTCLGLQGSDGPRGQMGPDGEAGSEGPRGPNVSDFPLRTQTVSSSFPVEHDGAFSASFISILFSPVLCFVLDLTPGHYLLDRDSHILSSEHSDFKFISIIFFPLQLTTCKHTIVNTITIRRTAIWTWTLLSSVEFQLWCVLRELSYGKRLSGLIRLPIFFFMLIFQRRCVHYVRSRVLPKWLESLPLCSLKAQTCLQL